MTAVSLLPLALSGLGLLNRTWTPIGDDASMLYRTEAVGGRHTPLVGVYSTRGWAHPGPALYYALALPFNLMGRDPIDLLAAAVVINGASVALVLVAGYRLRGRLGLLVTALFLATLMGGLRPDVLIQPWNPYLPLIPYLGFLLLVWLLAERGIADTPLALPVTIGLASFLVQAHVAFVPLVGAAFAALAGSVLFARREGAARWPPRRTVATSAAVAVVLWMPPLIDLAVRSHNLKTLARYFTAGAGTPVGLEYGSGLLARHVALHGPWAGAHERVVFGNVQPSGRLILVVLFTLLVTLTVLTIRSRGWQMAGGGLVALSQLSAGAFAAARVEEPVLSYLIVWMLPLATFAWLTVALIAIDLTGTHLDRRGGARIGAGLRRTGLVALAILVAVQVGRASQHTSHPPLPRQEHASAVDSLVSQLSPVLQRSAPVRIEGRGDDFFEAWVGVVYGLHDHGIDFFTSDGAAGQKWGAEHAWRSQPVATTLTMATSLPTSFEDPVERCDSDPGVRRVATWDRLGSRDRRRLKALQIANFEAKGDLGARERAELAALSRRAWRLVVFEGDHVCG